MSSLMNFSNQIKNLESFNLARIPNTYKAMKKIAQIITLLVMAGRLAANAQTNTAVTSPPADWTNAAAAPTVTVNVSANPVIADTNAPMATAATNGVSVAVQVNVTNAASPDANPAADATATAAPPAATAGPAGTIPLINFSDVPITTAIENLARQGGINYLLDPKIGYGLADANGQIKPEPQLSIRWENISAENALLALLDNYGLQLIVDKHTGIDRITMKDPTAPPPLVTRVVQLEYASVSNMLEAVQSAFTDKRSKVIGDRRTSQMVVVATDPEQQGVDILIKQLDRPTKQVLIETKLVEIASQPQTSKGVNWASTLGAQNVAFGNGIIDPTKSSTVITSPGLSTSVSSTSGSSGSSSTTTTTPGGAFSTGGGGSVEQTILNLVQGNGGFTASTAGGLIPSTGFLTADGLKAVISFMNQSLDAQIMSTPRIVTLDNETASIEVTRQFPIINFGGGTQNSSGSSSVTYSNVGTILQVTPRISANDKIWLKVSPEVSSHFSDTTITIPGNAQNPSFSFPVPIFDVRRLTTQVLIPNGNTLVMGGLVQDNPSANYTKVPFLGDVPGLGWAFRSESKSLNKDDLVIFLTPTIVQDSDFRETPTDFLQSQPTTMKSPMNPHTMWDGAQARGNWSNPLPESPGEFESTNKLNNW
jgi:type II secretory pathway component GspD/PulD (secretin)